MASGGCTNTSGWRRRSPASRRVALKSASWGLGQIMGFNAAVAGFRDAEDMVARMMRGASVQLLGTASFLRVKGMHAALRCHD
jgi:hypothetical protein